MIKIKSSKKDNSIITRLRKKQKISKSEMASYRNYLKVTNSLYKQFDKFVDDTNRNEVLSPEEQEVLNKANNIIKKPLAYSLVKDLIKDDPEEIQL